MFVKQIIPVQLGRVSMKKLEHDKKNGIDAKPEGSGTDPLGSIAKSASASTQEHRQKRFLLLSKIRNIYLKEGTERALKHATSYHRTSLCKHACTGSGGVELHLLQKAKKAFYTGLQTCGSVWTCPICANKIQEVRRQEIACAMNYFYELEQKHQAVMITFTFPHAKTDKLAELLKKFKVALKSFKSGRPFIRFKKEFGYKGLIRSLEVTHGENGWHPHTHELFFVLDDIDEDKFASDVRGMWWNFCLSVGLVKDKPRKKKEFFAHAIDVKFKCSTSEYLAKQDDAKHWGVDREIARGVGKSENINKGKHPFKLADENNHELFIEYTTAIKNTAQIYWTPGLKDLVGVNDIDDETAAELEGEDEVIDVGNIPKRLWHTVTKKELRANVLELAEEEKDIVYIRSFIFAESKNE